MIDLRDCEPVNIMPQALRKDARVRATGFALKKTAGMLMEKIDRTAVYAGIDLLPEKIVDLLAVELRAQYYDTALSIEDKRKAVKKALLWHCKAGTVSAVEELTNLVWKSDSAQVQEWFDYGSAPYLFRILLETNISIEEEKINAFLDALWKVKNTRSHLESITFKRRMEQTLYMGAAPRSWGNVVITDVWKDTYREHKELHSRAGVIQRKRIQIREG